jgi:TDG/mug DNA glycosylase family protein
VGINPSLTSAAVGHHFAGPGNPFWRLLHAAGLVPAPLTFADDARVVEFGLALTNIVERATRSAGELTTADYARGARRLRRLIAALQPAVVAFVGSTVYRRFVGPRAGGGCGPKAERLGTARVFVVPNPSGRNAAYPGFRDKLVWYRRLRAYVAALEGAQAPGAAARPSGRGAGPPLAGRRVTGRAGGPSVGRRASIGPRRGA